MSPTSTKRLELGFAVCRLTHTPKPDYAENPQPFMKLAIGDDLNAMLEELDAHLLRELLTIRGRCVAGLIPSRHGGVKAERQPFLVQLPCEAGKR